MYNPNLINCYIEASSKENLMKLMLLNNVQNSQMFSYQTPQKEDKKYVVWFFADISNLVKVKESDLDKKIEDN